MEDIKTTITKDMLKFLNSFDEGFIRFDTDGTITLANFAMIKMLGYQNENDIIGIPLTSHSKDHAEVHNIINEIYSKEKINNYKLLIVRNDGSHKWLLCNFKKVLITKDTGYAIEGVIRETPILSSSEITTTPQELETRNLQLSATELQFRATNQQLAANNQQLIANDKRTST